MKKINTHLIIAFMLTITSVSYSQLVVKAGLNFANMSYKDNYGTLDNKMVTGIHFGATAEFPINEMFSFETGLLLSTKGSKRTESTPYGIDYDYKGKPTYLDIPLTLKVTKDMNGIKYFGIFGPYIGIGIGGQIYEDGEGEKIKWGSHIGTDELITDDNGIPILDDNDQFVWDDSDDLKRLDYGLIIGGGVEINNFQIGLNYSLGLANLSPDKSDGLKVSNSVFGISVGYKLNFR